MAGTAWICAAAASLLQAPEPGAARWRDYPEADALRYGIRLVLDPAQRRASGTVDYRFRAVAPLEEIRLDATSTSGWEVAFEDAGGTALASRWEEGRVRVLLPRAAAAGEEVAFRARLAGTPPDGLYFASTRYGEPCVFTDHFPARARGWLPCEDHPADRAAFALALAVPEGLDAVGSGAVVGDGSAEPQAPEGFRWHAFETRSDLPTYLLAFAAAPFARVQEEGEARLAPHFVYRNDLPRARRALRHHAAWMQAMEAAFGPFAYEKYCVVQIPTRWGGMENAGNIFVMEGIFDQNRAGVSILAHEFAHQWFGDGVGYGDWSEIWLSEGFASYFGPWLDEKTGGPPFRQELERMRRSWLSSEEGRKLPVHWRDYPDPEVVINANAYPKGAWVLHMLRGELGDEAFFAGLRSYYGARRGRTATTADLRAAMEKAAGRDLAWFFEQWLDRPGCPELRFEWRDGGVTVRQVQEGPPYRFRLALQWTGADGVERRERFEIRDQETGLALDGAPIRVPVVDPGVELLFRRVPG